MFRAAKAATRFRLLQNRVKNPPSQNFVRFQSVDAATKITDLNSLVNNDGMVLEDDVVQTAFEASTKFADYGLGLHHWSDFIFPSCYMQTIPDFLMNVCNMDAALAIFASQLAIRGLFMRFWLVKEIEIAENIQKQNPDVLNKIDAGGEGMMQAALGGIQQYTAKMETMKNMNNMYTPGCVDSSGSQKAILMGQTKIMRRQDKMMKAMNTLNPYKDTDYEKMGPTKASWLRKYDMVRWILTNIIKVFGIVLFLRMVLKLAVFFFRCHLFGGVW